MRKGELMISVTRLNGKMFVINSELIEFMESTPDTVITLITGKKIIVTETIDEIIEKTVKYRKKVNVLSNLKYIQRNEV